MVSPSATENTLPVYSAALMLVASWKASDSAKPLQDMAKFYRIYQSLPHSGA